MLVELRYLDTCYPDFFQGTPNEVMIIPTYQTDDIEDVVDAIFDELNCNCWSQGIVLENEEEEVKELAEYLFSVWKTLDWDDASDDIYIYSYIELYPLEEDTEELKEYY